VGLFRKSFHLANLVERMVERIGVTKEENEGRQGKEYTCKALVFQGVFQDKGKEVKPLFKDSKSVVPQGTVGSNPTPSANKNRS
jgi:uncharacterized protein YajQ (UPF0234 family)